MFLGIKVISVEFQDSAVDKRLRIKGRISFGPEDLISINSSHTLNVKENTNIIIQKEQWTKIHNKLIKEATASKDRPSIGIVAIEKGYFSIGILNNFKIQNLTQERQIMPRKSALSKIQKKTDVIFYKKLLGAITNYFHSEIKHIVIGGPGLYKSKFISYLNQEWHDHNKIIISEDLSSGSYSGLQEILNRETVQKIAGKYQVIEESRIIKEFEKLLVINIEKVCYGSEQSLQAAEQGAIESFLITNSFITDKENRLEQKIDNLLDILVKTKVKLLIIDNSSDNGRIVDKFGGMLGILRYSLF